MASMGLKVIGTGQPRTGTFSLKLALERLGFGPCFHMLTLIEEHPEHIKYFTAARDGKPVAWKELFDSYGSAVDVPAALYARSILEAYPDAKIIHTVRDPEAWYGSVAKTVFKASQPSPLKKFLTLIKLPFSPAIQKRLPVLAYAGRMIRELYGPNLKDKESVLKAHQRYEEETLKSLPKDKVLIFSVKDGWEPLCAFLGVPVPNEPFPKANSTEEFTARAARL
jgi:hypothetical protein